MLFVSELASQMREKCCWDSLQRTTHFDSVHLTRDHSDKVHFRKSFTAVPSHAEQPSASQASVHFPTCRDWIRVAQNREDWGPWRSKLFEIRSNYDDVDVFEHTNYILDFNTYNLHHLDEVMNIFPNYVYLCFFHNSGWTILMLWYL